MKQTSLYFQEGNSDKEYHIQITQKGNGYVVNFQYGRRGNALQSGTKTDSPVSLPAAEKIFDSLKRSKEAKGYEEKGVPKKNQFADMSGSMANPPAERNKKVIMLPQLLNAIELEQVYELINDESRWVTQEKKDGERRMIISKNGKVIGLNKKGQEVPLPKIIMDSVYDDMILDGEIIGDKYYTFDLLSFNGKSILDYPLVARLILLDKLKFGNAISIVKTAYTTEEKQEMFTRIKNENREGIVFKNADTTYKPGRPNSGGDALKYKFTNTATFIVESATKNKRSVGLSLMEGKNAIFMGKVTIPPNYEVPDIGDLVEVRYLYAYKGGAIFQPVYLGKRTDQDLTDATMKQITFKRETSN